MPPEIARRGNPNELFGEGFAGRIGVDEGLHAQTGAGAAGIGEGAEDNVETRRGLLDGGFGEARDLKKAASNSRIAGGVEGGGRFGLVRGDSGSGIKIKGKVRECLTI